MIFYTVIEGRVHEMDVPQNVIDEGGEFYDRMDRDMDGGWQMSREWIEHPDTLNRCQIAADRIVTAMTNGKETLAHLMAGYIMTRMPNAAGVQVDTSGEMLNNAVITANELQQRSRPVTRAEAREQAEKEVAQVFKIGKAYRYATYDRLRRTWVESETFVAEAQAEAARETSVDSRLEELMQTRVWVG